VCEHCGTVLPKRYLRVVGADQLKTEWHYGDRLNKRYIYVGYGSVIDTQPGELPTTPRPMPAIAVPYLRLFAQRPHIPIPYSTLHLPGGPSLLLLESAPLDATGRPFPSLTEVQDQVSPLRQLYWFWQMVQLWTPCHDAGVTASLLDPHLLRVEGPWLRLLELRPNGDTAPRLAQLGRLWIQWVAPASPLHKPIQALSQNLILGQITTPQELLDQLDPLLQHLAHQRSGRLALETRTDQGPSRARNEDACAPPSPGSVVYPLGGDSEKALLTLVCDGLGGHDGGDVASQLAIAHLQARLSPAHLDELVRSHPSPQVVTETLQRVILETNEILCDRNDREMRSEHRRMGTTLVLALQLHHELYIAHIGDSRAYCITRQGCHQITLDDDMASREVRLACSFYREASSVPIAGSLVQALGTNASMYLYPTVRRFWLEDDCLFLLCSDGLSDFDLVETHWRRLFYPVITGDLTLADAANQAIAFANQTTGHDNVTLALLQVQAGSPQDQRILVSTPKERPTPARAFPPTLTITPPKLSCFPGQWLPGKRFRSDWRWWLGGAIALTGMVWLWPRLQLLQDLNQPTVPTQTESPAPSPRSPQSVAIGDVLEIAAPNLVPGDRPPIQPAPLTLRSQPSATASTLGILPNGSVVEVLAVSAPPTWLHLHLCGVSAVPPTAAAATTLTTGTHGWIQRAALLPNVRPSDLPPCTKPTS
jgi:protein phosphatase